MTLSLEERGRDTIFGGEGNDLISGEDGNDILVGVALDSGGTLEQDTLTGGLGPRSLYLRRCQSSLL
jgi:Ca2+-binding RTX toxin-like protein